MSNRRSQLVKEASDSDSGSIIKTKKSSGSIGRISEESGRPTSSDSSSSDSDDSDASSRKDEEEEEANEGGTEGQDELLKFYGLTSLGQKTWTKGMKDGDSDQSSESEFEEEDPEEEYDLLEIGGVRSAWRSLNESGERGIYPSREDFDEKKYLSTLYKNVSFSDLQKGAKTLEKKVKQRTEGLRSLVAQNLDAFISCKDTIDSFHSELQSRELTGETKGLEKLSNAVKASVQHTDAVFGPLVERSTKVDHIRRTIDYLEQHRFLFNLPASLGESIAKRHFDAAVREFKRGSQYVAEVKGAAFEKIWNEVLRMVEDLKLQLERLLTDPYAPIENQERIIEHLLELDLSNGPPVNPAWLYLKSQFDMIANMFRDAFEDYQQKCTGIIGKISSHYSHDYSAARLDAIRNAHIDLLRRKDFEQYEQTLIKLKGEEGAAIQMWHEKSRLMKKLSFIMTSNFPNFWKFVKSYLEGKYVKKSVQKQKVPHAEVAQTMPTQLIDYYLYFALSTFSLSASKPPPDFKPSQHPHQVEIEERVHSISKCYFLVRGDASLVSCFETLRSLKLPDDLVATLSSQVALMKQSFIEKICSSATKEIQEFYVYEDWTPNLEASQTTLLPTLFIEFTSLILLSLREIVGEPSPQGKRNTLISSMSSANPFSKTIEDFFFGGLLSLVDNLHALAFNEMEKIKQLPSTPITSASKLLFATFDAKSQGVRFLAILSNLSFVKDTVLPTLAQKAADLIDVNPSKFEPIRETIAYLDTLLFESYTREKCTKMCDIIERGVLYNGVDWETMPKPLELRSYLYTLLLEMVFVHSEVHSNYKVILWRILSEILTSIALKFLVCFRKIPLFGIGGMLQATLEVEFIHQTLLAFENKASKDAFQRVYSCIDAQGKIKDQAFKSDVSAIRDILKTAKKSTETQFLCLREAHREL